MNKNEMHTVEWSEKQQCFHIDTLKGVLEKNLQLFLNGINSEYALITILNSHIECHELVRNLKELKSVPQQINDI